MSEPEPDADPPDPLIESKRIARRQARRFASQKMRPLHGRLLFFALGLAIMVASAFDNALWFLPWAGGAAVLTLRLTRGKEFRWVSYIVGAVTVPLMLIVALLGWVAVGGTFDSVLEWFGRTSVDPVVWQAPEEGSEDRIRMIDDLLSSGRLDGASRAEVDELLGKDDRDAWAGYSQSEDWDRVYWLGRERGGFFRDDELLVVRFDETGKVTEARIVRD